MRALIHGGSNRYVKNSKVYQSEQEPEFVRIIINDTNTTTDSIDIYEDERVQNGIYRYMDSNRDTEYGTQIFAKSRKSGEKTKEYHLKKYASGEIAYQENILIYGQDTGWRTLTKYKFIPQKLDWEKVNL